MKCLRLSGDKEAKIDSRFCPVVNRMGKWSACHKGTNSYAVRNEPRADGRKRQIYMHHVIWSLAGRVIPRGLQIDHINRDGLDNRLTNLRLATIQEQRRNRRKRQGCTSQYKGVCWCSQKEMWRATIKDGNNQRHLGFFPKDQEKQAAKAYDEAAKELFGEFAAPNLRKAN